MIQPSFDDTLAAVLSPPGSDPRGGGPSQAAIDSQLPRMAENYEDKTLEYIHPHYHTIAEDGQGDFKVGMKPDELLKEYTPWTTFVGENYRKPKMPGRLAKLLKKYTTAKNERKMHEGFI